MAQQSLVSCVFLSWPPLYCYSATHCSAHWTMLPLCSCCAQVQWEWQGPVIPAQGRQRQERPGAHWWTRLTELTDQLQGQQKDPVSKSRCLAAKKQHLELFFLIIMCTCMYFHVHMHVVCVCVCVCVCVYTHI